MFLKLNLMSSLNNREDIHEKRINEVKMSLQMKYRKT